MMLDWNGYRAQILAGIGNLAKVSPATLHGYRQLSEAGNKNDLLGAKIRELIALAVAVTRQCDGCITVHTDAALKHGATKEEIAEALGSLVNSTRVMDAMSTIMSQTEPRPET